MGLIGGIAAVATIGGELLSSSSKNHAADAAAQASQYSSDQAAQVTRENYDKSAAALAPWQQSGLRANSAIDALLGTGAPATSGPSTLQPTNWANVPASAWGLGDYSGGYGGFGGFSIPGLAQYWQQQQAAQQPTPATPAPTQQQNYQQAFDNYKNSTGYKFRVAEGMDAVNSGFAGRGVFQSGAALKGLDDYRQGMASQEFGQYLGALGNQQGLGSAAAAAQAGVAQKAGDSLAQIYQNSGDNQANAALLKSGSGLGSALSTIGGAAFKYGLGGY